MDEGLEQLVINGLSRHRSHDEIIREVCEQGGLKWLEAEELLRQVEMDHAHAIACGQNRLVLFLSVGFIVFGIAIFCVLNFALDYFQQLVLGELFGRRTTWYRIAGSITSLGMIVWGTIGLWGRARRYLQS